MTEQKITESELQEVITKLPGGQNSNGKKFLAILLQKEGCDAVLDFVQRANQNSPGQITLKDITRAERAILGSLPSDQPTRRKLLIDGLLSAGVFGLGAYNFSKLSNDSTAMDYVYPTLEVVGALAYARKIYLDTLRERLEHAVVAVDGLHYQIEIAGLNKGAQR